MSTPRRKTLEVTRRAKVSGAGATVLLADDDRAVIERIKAGLVGQGYDFIEASDGQSALSALREHQPDLLVMDVHMPVLSGVEVCRIVKANQGQGGFGFIPVILMTARTNSSNKVEGLELGADDYLVKPFDMLELSARLKSMLRLKSLQDALVEKNRLLDQANRELDRKRLELLELSRTDSLTGLINRRHFDERLAAEFARASRYQSPLSCFLLDIDHFKKVNDTWGHPFGDHVLREVAQVAKKALRDVDVLCRYGGEELIALLPETSPADAAAAAERVRYGIETLKLSYVDPDDVTRLKQPVKCTASIGVATWPRGTVDSPQMLVQAADDCLYAAKQAGRNQVRQHVD